ncbi:MAG: hypothetical protein ACYCSG_07180, partial [Thermoplasmataceae archaeon]
MYYDNICNDRFIERETQDLKIRNKFIGITAILIVILFIGMAMEPAVNNVNGGSTNNKYMEQSIMINHNKISRIDQRINNQIVKPPVIVLNALKQINQNRGKLYLIHKHIEIVSSAHNFKIMLKGKNSNQCEKIIEKKGKKSITLKFINSSKTVSYLLNSVNGHYSKIMFTNNKSSFLIPIGIPVNNLTNDVILLMKFYQIETTFSNTNFNVNSITS